MTDTLVSSHVSEEEMSTIQGLFARAANAIVDVSRLSVQVKDLEDKVSGLSQQVSSYRQQINWQDDMLQRMRTERDEAKDMASQALRDKDSAISEVHRISGELEHLQSRVSSLQSDNSSLTKERDDAEFRALELEERAQKAEKALNEVRDTVAKLFPPAVKEPEPVATPMPLVEVHHPHMETYEESQRREEHEAEQRRVGIDQPRTETGQYQPWEAGYQKPKDELY